MIHLQEYQRRCLVPLAGILLAIYYALVYQPLAHKARDLNEPLYQSWKKLASSVGRTNSTQLDFLLITNQLAETQQALATFNSARRDAAARLALGPALRARLDVPFELVEYQNERSGLIETLTQQAASRKVTVEPAVLEGFPEHTADVREPSLLWVELSMVNDLLNGALANHVKVLHSLRVPLVATNVASADQTKWFQVPIEMEFSATATNAALFLSSLPLRGDELKAAGLPVVNTEKLPLLIDRIVLRKQSPERLDEVRGWLRLTGFVPRGGGG
jgi:hypothetical protein